MLWHVHLPAWTWKATAKWTSSVGELEQLGAATAAALVSLNYTVCCVEVACQLCCLHSCQLLLCL
jgi:hypothetical protein